MSAQLLAAESKDVGQHKKRCRNAFKVLFTDFRSCCPTKKMVHVKYRYRGGKKYGPYYYENVRVGKKVVTTYLGREPPTKKDRGVTSHNGVGQHLNNFSIPSAKKLLLISFILLVGVSLFFLVNKGLTGRSTTSIETRYVPGEFLSGTLHLQLRAGELMPADSRVRIVNGQQSAELPLRDFISEEDLKNGNFFIENNSITGSGEGFGIAGTKEVYPKVSFQLRINGAGDGQTTAPETPIETPTDTPTDASTETPIETPTDTQTEPPAETPASEDASSASETIGGGALITGAAISESEQTVSGRVSKGEDYSYTLSEGESAELVSGSVEADEEVLDDSSVDVRIEDGNVIVSTDYSVIQEGFGDDYLGDGSAELPVDLSNFAIPINDTSLNIQIEYEGQTLYQIDETLTLEQGEVTNETSPEEPANISVPLLEIVKPFPLLRLAPNGTLTLSLSEYFIGAEYYEVDSIDNITSSLEGSVLILTVEPGFKGSRQGRVSAYANNESIAQMFTLLVSSGAVRIDTSHEMIKLGEPVKWTKNVSLDVPETLTVELPKEAENISVLKVDEEGGGEESNSEVRRSLVTGEVTAELTTNKNPWFVTFLGKIWSALTGRAIEEINGGETGEVNKIEVVLSDNVMEYRIEYYTDAPQSFEQEKSFGKEVVVFGPELNYTNVLSFTNISERYKIGEENRIRLYWKEEGTYLPFDVYDTDNNGALDYIEWNVPHLSNQTFWIILITKAEHLDENRSFVEDAFEKVNKRDGVYQGIVAGHYLRVTFEQVLDSSRDITLYARSNSTSRVEVYKENSSELIATFENITEDGMYKIYLSGMSGSGSVFDLGAVDALVEFDYVVDPDTDTPRINFTNPTPLNGTNQTSNSIFVNVSSNDSSDHYTFLGINRDVVLWMRMDDIDGSGNPYDLSSWSNNASKEYPAVMCYGSPSNSACSQWTNDQTNCELYENHSNQCTWYASDICLPGDYYCNIWDGDQAGCDAHNWVCTYNAFNNCTFNSGYTGNCSELFSSDCILMSDQCSRILGDSCEGTLSCSGQTTSSSCIGLSGCSWASINQSPLGYYGPCFDFNEGFLDIAHNPSLNINNTLTISLWIKPDSGSTTNNGLLYKGFVDAGSGPYTLFLNNNKAIFKLNGVSDVSSISNIPTGIWTQIVAEYNGTSQSIYINGVLENNVSFNSSIESNNELLYLGYYYNLGDSGYYNGLIDEVLIFNRSLSANEVKSLYNASAYQYKNNFTGLAVGNYTFTGYTVDSAGNRNNTGERTVRIDPPPPPFSNITSCQDLSNTNWNYQLISNVTSIGTCFAILASNVTLNCQGYSINFANSTPGYGINASEGYNNSIIKNCNIRTVSGGGGSGNIGIYVKDSINSTIYNNTIFVNGTSENYGLLVSNLDYSNISSNIIRSEGSGANNVGIGLSGNINDESRTFGNTFFNNSVTTNTTYNSQSDCYALFITAGRNNSFISNIFASGGYRSDATVYSYVSQLSTFVGNRFSINERAVTSSGDSLIILREHSFGNSFYNNTFNYTGPSNMLPIVFSVQPEGGLYADENIFSGNAIEQWANRLDFYTAANINVTYFINQPIQNYSILGNGTRISVENTTYGKILFLSAVNGSGGTLYGYTGADIVFGNNSVFVNTSGNAGLNKGANVTLYGLPINYIFPVVLKNGATCADCYSFTSLNAGTVVFNVSSWSNYSIGEEPGVVPVSNCSVLSTNGLIYRQNVSIIPTNLSIPCINITASNATFDGNGKWIANSTFNGTAVEISANSVNVTVKNANVTLNNSGSSVGLYNKGTLSVMKNSVFYGGNKMVRIGDGAIVNNLTFTGGVTGLYFGNNNIATNITSISSNTGIAFNGSINNTLTGANVNGASSNAIDLQNNSLNNTISQISGNGNTYGLNFGFASGNNFSNIDLTGGLGIKIAGGTYNQFSNFNIHQPTNGISFENGGDGNNFTNGLIDGATQDAISFSTSAHLTTFTNISITNTALVYYDLKISDVSNYTSLIDSPIKAYSIINKSIVIIKSSSFGEVRFLAGVNGTGGNFSRDIQLRNNFAYVNSSQTGLNVSANITLYSVTKLFTNPKIFKDGVQCTDCYNFTNLSAGTVIFNVTSWSNYTIFGNDTYYPLFSDIYSNNGSLLYYGYALFNATITNTNGTVFLSINGANYSTTNNGAAYNISLYLYGGDYAYYWGAYGNGPLANYNISSVDYYTVNYSSDTEPPKVFLFSPSNGTTVYTTNITFRANLTDNILLKNATFYIWNSSGRVVYNSSSSLFTQNYSFNTSYSLAIGGNYSWNIKACDLANSCAFNLTNYTFAYIKDETYPLFSNYWDNNDSVNSSNLAWFNVSVANTNGTVYLHIDGEDIAAVNSTFSNYNASTSLIGGNFPYYWWAYGNGTDHIYNASPIRYYWINDTSAPRIFFVYPTPANASSQSTPAFVVNISSRDFNLQYAFLEIDNSLVLWLRMDDTNSSGDPVDLSSWSNNGSLKDNAKINSTGRFGKGAWFDGSNDIISLSNFTGLPLNNSQRSFSFWVNPLESQSKNIMGYGGDSTQYYYWDIVLSGGIIGIHWFGNSVTSEFPNTAYTPNQWQHVAFVYNGSMIFSYVNGANKDNVSVALNTGNTQGLKIAAGRYSTYDYFTGGIEEILIFNRSLSAGEVSSLFNSTANQYFSNFSFSGEGVHNFKGYGVDANAYMNFTEKRWVTLDTTAPRVNLLGPSNGSTINGPVVSLNASFSDNYGLANATLFVWNSSGSELYSSTTSISGTSASLNTTITLNSEGQLYWNYRVSDAAGNSRFNNTNYTFIVPDVYLPLINFTYPTPVNNVNLSATSILVNVSSYDSKDTYTFLDFNRTLMLWMRMDDINSTNGVTDLSSWSNNGTNISNSYRIDNGVFGKSFNFTGSGGYINISGSRTANFTGRNITISLWINPRVHNDGGIFFKGPLSAGGDDGVVSMFLLNGAVTFRINGLSDATTTPISYNQWTHITAVYNRTKQSIYVNGLLNGSTAYSDNIMPNEDPLAIGAYYTPTNTFNGSIDEVLVFTRALAAQEILSLYNASANQYTWNISNTLLESSYKYTAYAVDAAGNRNQTEERTVNIDRTAPKAFLAAPANGTTIFTNTISFNATFTDNIGLANATLYIWNSAGAVVNNSNNINLGGTSGSVNISLTLPYRDSFKWNYLVIDSAGNKALNNTNFTIIYEPTNLTQCGSLNIANVVYTLINNVTSNGTCFNIMANNVTLNGQGYMINYSANGTVGYGVNVSGWNYSIVKNARIEEGSTTGSNKYAIYISSASNGTIQNNIITTLGYGGHGIHLESSSDIIMVNNSIATSGGGSYGIYLTTSSNSNTLINNTVNTLGSPSSGIYIYQSSNLNNIINNSVSTLMYYSYGIQLSYSSYNNVSGNKVISNQTNSYFLEGSSIDHYNNSVDVSNLAEGKPVNYTFNANNLIFDGIDFTQFGQVIFGWSRNITLRNSNFSDDSLNLFYTSNSTINNNYINTSTGYGIYAYQNAKNNIFSGNTIITSGSEHYGIRLETTSDSNTIANNTIMTYGYAGRAVCLTQASSNIILNNTITTYGTLAVAVRLRSSSNYNQVIGNNMLTVGGGYGIYFYSDALYNFVNNNNITSLGSGGYGIYVYSSSYHNIVANTSITTSGTTDYGLYFASSSTNNTFSGMNIRTNNTEGYAIYVGDTNHNFTLSDSKLNSSYSGVVDVNISASVKEGTWNFTNVTRADGTPINVSWSAGANGTLIMNWYADVQVNYSNGAAMSGGQVNATNIYGSTQTTTTDSSGRARLILTEYIRNNTSGSNITYFSNYSINVTYFTQRNGTSVNMSTNRYVQFTLIDATPPSINFTFPTPANGSSQMGTSIYVNVSSNDVSRHYTFLEFDNDVRLWLRMDDLNATGDPTDLSRWRNNASRKNHAAQNASGFFNSSFKFDGIDDYLVTKSPVSSLNSSDNFTISLWMNSGSSTTGTAFFAGDKASDTRFFTALFIGSGKIIFRACKENVNCNDTDFNININKWYHLVGVYSNKNMSLYINGLNSNGTLFSYDTIASSSISTYIGVYSTTGTNYFNGSIDEVIFFNRSLNAQEVGALYNASANQYFRNFTDLEAGNHTFTAFAVDQYAHENQTQQWTVSIPDLVPPKSFLTGPLNGTIVDTSYVSFNATLTDNYAVANTTFYIWNSTGRLINSTSQIISGISANVYTYFNLPNYGNYSWNYLVFDAAGNSAFNITNFTVNYIDSDVTPPGVTLVAPSNGILVENESISFNATFSDNKNLSNATFYLWNFTGSVINTTARFINGTSNSINLTVVLPSNGTYYWNYLAYDVSGNSAWAIYNYSIIFNVISYISTCQELNISGMTYILNQNVYSNGTCFNVAANSVTLDGQGKSVIYANNDSTGYGIYSRGYNLTTIKNINFYQGNVTASTRYGIYLLNTYNWSILSNNITTNSTNSYGIQLFPGRNLVIRYNSIYTAGSSGGIGISLFPASTSTISDNKISTIGTLSYGIVMTAGSANNTIYANTIITNNSATTGIYGAGSTTTGNYLISNNISTFNKSIFFSGGTNYLIYNNSFGEIRWANSSFLNALVVSGNLTFPGNIVISSNKAYLNSTAFTGENINSSANITLYGLPTTMVNPRIYKDGAACTDCWNFTSLNAGTVVFNVSSWSNYSIFENLSITECGNLTVANKIYTLMNDVSTNGTCFRILNNSITLDGNWLTVSGDNSGHDGIYALNVHNITIHSFKNLSNWGSFGMGSGEAIYLEGVNYSRINNISIYNSRNGIILYSNSSWNNISTVNLSTFASFGVSLRGNSSNNIFNQISIINDNGNGVGIELQTGADNNQFYNTTLNYLYSGISISSSSNNIFTYGIINGSISGTITLNTLPNSGNTFINISITNSNPSSKDLIYNSASINSTSFIDMPSIANYSFTGVGGTIIVKKTGLGEIRFIQPVNGSGTNFSRDIQIGNNSVYVNVSSNGGLNRSANITLYGLGTFSNPKILKDGAVCSDCYNFTSLNAGTVVFNVSSWSNYSVGEWSDISPPNINFTAPTPANDSYLNYDDVTVNVTSNENLSSCNIIFTNYEQPVNITISTSTSTGFDYQVSVSLNSTNVGSHFNWSNTCNDVDFTNMTRTGDLPYWIEYCNSTTQTAKIWVKLDANVSAASNYTIYMTYDGYSNISSGNGDNVFIFFDDFSGSAVNTSKWTIDDSTGLSVSNGELVRVNRISQLYSTQHVMNDPATESLILETKVRIPTASVYVAGFWTDTNNDDMYAQVGNDYLYYGATGSLIGTTPPAGMNLKVRMDCIVNGDTCYGYVINYSSGSTINSGSIPNILGGPSHIMLEAMGGSATIDARYDWIFVREYNANPPSVNVGGELSTYSMSLNNAGASTTANIALSNLHSDSPSGSLYQYYVNCSDLSSNYNFTETRQFTTDLYTPIMSGLNFNIYNSTLAWIWWNANEQTNGSVNYGTTSALGTFASNSSYSILNNISLQNLNLGNYYYYNITYCDRANNCNSSGTYSLDYVLPILNFTYPTLADGSSTTNNYALINVSIVEQGLSNVMFNWNGTNFTMYNESLLLMMNFENLSSLGENDTFVRDLSLYGNNGSCSGTSCPNWNISGKFGGAYKFDGVNDYISIGTKISSSTWNNLTFTAWVKTGANGTTSRFVSMTNGSTNSGPQFYIRMSSNAKAYVGARGSGSDTSAYVEGLNRINDSLWHQVTGVINGLNGSVQLYVDGVYQGINYTGSSFTLTNLTYTTIGNVYPELNQLFNGTIDEVRIWNRSLSASEVYEQYASNLNKFNGTQWYLYVNQSKNGTAGLDSGTYTYQAFASDISGFSNQTEQRSLSTDSSAPKVFLTAPSNGSSIPSLTVSFNATFSDNVGLANATLYIWNSTSIVNSTNNVTLSGTSGSVNISVTLPRVGTYFWNYLAYDSAGGFALNNTNYTLTTYILGSEINFTNPTPANGTTQTSASVAINVSISEIPPLANVMFNWNGTNYSMFDSSLITSLNFESANQSEITDSNTNYSATQGTNNWFYYYSTIDTNTYSQMIYNSTNGAWQKDNAAEYIPAVAQTYSHPGATDSVRSWNSSFNGAVVINISISDGDAGCGDGVNYTVKQGNSYLFSADYANGFAQVNVSLVTKAAVGDMFYFRATRKSSLICDTTLERIKVYVYTTPSNAISAANISFGGASSTVGKFGNAFNFDGADDFAYVLNSFTYQNFTIALWLKPGANQVQYADILETNHSTGINWVIQQDNTNVNNYSWGVADNSSAIYFNLSAGVWTHLVISRDSASKNNTLYLNGILQRASNGSGDITYGNNAWLMLAKHIIWGRYWNGSMDELRVWNRSMTAAEVRQHYFSNLYKFNSTQWYLYVNQSKNVSTGLNDGTYTYQAFASDIYGNSNQTEVRTITVDSSSPKVYLSAPNNGSVIESLTISFNATFSDNLGLLNATLYVWNSTSLVNFTNRTISGTSAGANITVTLPRAGQYWWNYLAKDASNNGAFNLTNWTLFIDLTPPSINFTSPTPANGTSQTATNVQINVSITESSLGSVKFNWNGTNTTLYDDSLVLMMNFENRSELGENDTFVRDLSRYGNNGSFVDAKYNISGRYGKGLDVSGVHDYIRVLNSPSLSLMGVYSLEAWYYPYDMEGGWRAIFGKGRQIWFGTNGGYFVITYESGATWQNHNTAGYSSNQWYHLVGIVDNTNDVVQIYINGQLIKNDSETDDMDDWSSYDVTIGTEVYDAQSAIGIIDEARIWNRTLSQDEVKEHYMSNLYKYNLTQWYLYVNQSKNSTAGLDFGNYTYQAFASDLSGNANQTEQRHIQIYFGNSAPNTPTVSINSSDGSNKTLSDLNCFATITDPDSNLLNVSVRWYNGPVLGVSADYNNSYASGVLFSATLDDGNTTKNENWSCIMRLSDGSFTSGWGYSGNLTVLNSPPAVTLYSPADYTANFSRGPRFMWSTSDDDGDAITNHYVNITPMYGGNAVSDDTRTVTTGSVNFTYNVTPDLKYFEEDLYYYLWSVRASDGVSNGSWTSPWRYNVTVLVMINLINDSVVFNTLNFTSWNDSTTNSPYPFVIENSGNVHANISISAADLWATVSNPSKYYKFKADNASEGLCYDNRLSLINWANMSLTGVGSNVVLVGLNYTNSNDTAEVDIYVESPPNEPPGYKNSTVYFVESRGY